MSESVLFHTSDGDIQQVPPQRMSLRQRMLSPSIEQQQEKSPSPEVATGSPSVAVSSGSLLGTASAGSSLDGTVGSLEGSANGGGEGAMSETEMSDVERGLRERFAKMEESGHSWTEKGAKSMKIIDSELRNLDGVVAGLTSEIKEAARLESDIKKKQKSGELSKETAQQMLQSLTKMRKDMQQAKRGAEPQSAGFISEMLMGKLNVKLYRDGERYVMKSKYEQFKQRSAIPFIILIVLSFVFPTSSLVKSIFFVC